MRWCAAIVLAAGLVAGAADAGPVTLTVDQLREFGSAAVLRGFADEALAVAEALLARDRADSLALTLRAQALRIRGDLAGSERAARQAWAAAGDDAARYAAATALAQALSLQNRRTMAQYWLRQASQNAPSPGARAQALADFNYVRDQNPLRLQLQASLRPSNNVNGGTRETSFYVPIFGGLDLPYLPSDRALSGEVWSLGVSGSYKLRDTGALQDALTFAVSGQGAALSARARAAAPALRNGDFSFGQIEAGFQRKLALPGSLITLDLTGGHSWYGGDDMADSLLGQVTLDTKVTDRISGSFTASLHRQTRLDRPQSSSTEAAIQASLGRRGPRGDYWELGLDLSQSYSQDTGVGNRAATLSLAWRAAEPVLGLDLGASTALRVADYDNGRHDARVSLGLSGSAPGLSYLGFSPVLSLDAARNTSTNSRFSTDTFGVGLSLKSSF